MNKLSFDYIRPTSVQEAVTALQTPDARVIAGGTDLMIEMKEQRKPGGILVDVTAIPEMTEIWVSDDVVKIGAAVSFTDISNHPIIRQEFTALAQAASLVGSPQIRNRGTIGGNVSTGSSAGDTLCPLTAFGADLLLVGPEGEEIINIIDFWASDRQKELSVRTLLVKIILHRNITPTSSSFIKLGRRESLAISRLSVALTIRRGAGGHILEAFAAIGSAGRHAYRVPEVGPLMMGKFPGDVDRFAVEKSLSDAVSRTLGTRSTARYKAQAVQALGRQAMEQLGLGAQ